MKTFRLICFSLFCVIYSPLGTLGQESDAEPTVVQEEEVQPYWYQPGHPLDPAEAAGITCPPGFDVQKCYSVPEEQGSWTAITTDDRGRLICAAQHRPGLYRITPGTDTVEGCHVELMTGAAEKMGWCHGLLHAFDSLYVTIGEENDFYPTGLYRLTDEDRDDQFEKSELILPIETQGEHAYGREFALG